MRRLASRLRKGVKHLLPDEEHVHMAFALSLLFVGAIAYITLISPPKRFPTNTVVTVEKGAPLSSVAQSLKQQNVIRSQLAFRLSVTTIDGENGVKAGDYVFQQPLSAFGVAGRVTRGAYNLQRMRITVPEGANIYQIAEILHDTLDDFPTSEFLSQARGKEGYLFPDTYYFQPNVQPREVIDVMEHTFWKKLNPLRSDIETHERSVHEILTMASILEKEARDYEERRMIAGILWNRIEDGMPLQVDAAFSYVNGKNSFTLTEADLVATTSPYNTYTTKGLPPGPIANPSLESIKAALNPIDNDYVFYLHGRNGNIHYARTHEGHKRNKRRYLK